MEHASSRTITPSSTPIELCQLLKFAGLVGTGGEAKQVIGAGLVEVNGLVETRKGKKLNPGDRISFAGETLLIA